jgi:hypothetical protein
MQQVSLFVAECLCGRSVETPSRDYSCPRCNRHIRLEWGRDPGAKPEPESESDAHSAVKATA